MMWGRDIDLTPSDPRTEVAREICLAPARDPIGGSVSIIFSALSLANCTPKRAGDVRGAPLRNRYRTIPPLGPDTGSAAPGQRLRRACPTLRRRADRRGPRTLLENPKRIHSPRARPWGPRSRTGHFSAERPTSLPDGNSDWRPRLTPTPLPEPVSPALLDRVVRAYLAGELAPDSDFRPIARKSGASTRTVAHALLRYLALCRALTAHRKHLGPLLLGADGALTRQAIAAAAVAPMIAGRRPGSSCAFTPRDLAMAVQHLGAPPKMPAGLRINA